MTNVVLTPRDIEILRLASRIGFLTETQICALFYSKHNGFELDLYHARGSLARRIKQLVDNGYLAKSTIPVSGTINRVAYLLGPNGAEAIRDTRGVEGHADPRWLAKRSGDLLIRSRHDIIATNFLVNLMMLSKLVPDFTLLDWIPDRDCRFYVPRGNKKLIVNPDLYVSVINGSPDGSTLFLQVDRDTLDNKSLRIMMLRFFQYGVSRIYKTDLSSPRFPRICIAAPSASRLDLIRSAVIAAKENYSGAEPAHVSRMPFWLATFDNVEINSLDRGFVTRKPLDPVWVNEFGKPLPSPLLP